MHPNPTAGTTHAQQNTAKTYKNTRNNGTDANHCNNDSSAYATEGTTHAQQNTAKNYSTARNNHADDNHCNDASFTYSYLKVFGV